MNSMLKNFLIKHNIIKGTFYIEAFVYIDGEDKNPVSISDTIKWLRPFTLTCKYKDRNKRAFEMLNYKYPGYMGYINLF